jgi:hypothetical protein
MFNSSSLTEIENNFLNNGIKRISTVHDTNGNLVKETIGYSILLLLFGSRKNEIDFESIISRITPIDAKIAFYDLYHLLIKNSTCQCLKTNVGDRITHFISNCEVFTSLSLNPKVLLDLKNQYSFSLDESSSKSLGPHLLSLLCENLPQTSLMKKKTGKYYTLTSDAQILSFLAVFRYLKYISSNITEEELLTLFVEHRKNREQKISKLGLNNEIRILDPACGSGEFLYQVALIFEKIAINNGDSVKILLTGMDLDPIALVVVKLRLLLLELLWIEKYHHSPVQLTLNIINEDFLTYTLNQKYDIIIGNPPWVRHEDIGLNKKSNYKMTIHKKLLADMKQNISFDMKSDLYIYFCLRSMIYLAEDLSILALLTSNAWLEVSYGKTLQNYLLDLLLKKDLTSCEVIHQAGSRLWKEIGINSIFFIVSKMSSFKGSKGKFLFTELNKSMKDIDLDSSKHGILFGNEYSSKDYRTENISIEELQRTHKWAGNFLRASSSERNVFSIITTKGVPLSDLAHVRFGIKTGANDFFYVQSLDQDITKKDIKIKNSLSYKGRIEKKFLKPVVKSPVEITGYIIPKNFNPKYWMFYCQKTESELEGSLAIDYIKWGEKQSVAIKQGKEIGKTVVGFQNLVSLSQRPLWYSITSYLAPDLLWTKSYHDKPGFFLNQALAIPDQRFYGVFVKNQEIIPLIFTYLNSSFVWAQIELAGNTNMGFGVLDTNVYWLKGLKIPTIKEKSQKAMLRDLFLRLKGETNRKSFLEESSIRNRLDDLYCEVLGINKTEFQILVQFIQRSVKNRLKGNPQNN